MNLIVPGHGHAIARPNVIAQTPCYMAGYGMVGACFRVRLHADF